jgi:hypothetical protein
MEYPLLSPEEGVLTKARESLVSPASPPEGGTRHRKGPCRMAQALGARGFAAPVDPDAPKFIVDLRAQAFLEGAELHGQLYVARYFADGSSDCPFNEDLRPSGCRRVVVGGLRCFAGHLAALSTWPELQCRTTPGLSTGQF